VKSFLLIGLFVLSNIGFSQSLILEKNETDEFTGTTKKVTNLVMVAKSERSAYGNLKFMLGHIGDQYALYVISSYDLGCSGAKSNYIHFLFEDGSSIKYDKDYAKIDCGDYNISFFLVNSEDFKDKVIKKIRYAKSDGYNDYLWTHESSINNFFEIVK
jgi:hypothetical protein